MTKDSPCAVKIPHVTALLVMLALTGSSTRGQTPEQPSQDQASAVLWSDPTDIASRDLFYGPGGERHSPQGTKFHFMKEDLRGTNAKLVVLDDAGTKWKVKMGAEAQSETAASRIVWAVGYFTDEDYYLPSFCVDGVPPKLYRAQKYLSADGCVQGARFERQEKDEANAGEWTWRQNPFTGTSELNGLRVLMAVINNWDLKDTNNHIRIEKNSVGNAIKEFLIGDLGVAFGMAHLTRGHEITRGNLEAYRQSPFIRKTTECCVDFAVPGRPAPIVLVNPKEYHSRLGLEWIGEDIPREDAKWMGALLGRLSATQIRDAFRAAGYSKEDADAFASVLEKRIAALREL